MTNNEYDASTMEFLFHVRYYVEIMSARLLYSAMSHVALSAYCFKRPSFLILTFRRLYTQF